MNEAWIDTLLALLAQRGIPLTPLSWSGPTPARLIGVEADDWGTLAREVKAAGGRWVAGFGDWIEPRAAQQGSRDGGFGDWIEPRAARQGGRDGGFSRDARVTGFQQATACDIERFKRFFHAMLAEGIYLAPSAYEAGFVSAAHSDADIAASLAAAGRAFAGIG